MIEAQLPKDKAVHVILDNHAAQKHAKLRAWLLCHPRWSFHFTPTAASWLNAAFGFCAKLSRRRLKHRALRSAADLQEAISRCLEEHDKAPKPFPWHARPRQNHRRAQPRVPNLGVNPLGAANPARPASRAGTKQAQLIALLEATEGATMEIIIAATFWPAHYADVRIMPTSVGKPAFGAEIVAMGLA